ncbi:ATP-binding cassette domain-containing protein [Rhodopseudomonas sp. BR0M22]|nr:ATP-binding cassette domain-containing protein [Rhodopseudomonas sp. BR0M22]
MFAAGNLNVLPRGVGGTPVMTLVLTTLALNILALALPVASLQMFTRMVANPGTPTLTVLVIAVIVCGGLEALLRIGRTYLISTAGAEYAVAMMQRVLDQVVALEPTGDERGASSGVEYIAAVQELKELYNGQLIVGIVELAFLPVILGLIVFVSPSAAVIVTLCIGVYCALTYRSAVKLRAAARSSVTASEEMYEFLFTVLSSTHLVKAMAVEESILRRYEKLQGRRVIDNHETALTVGRLVNGATIANLAITATMLVWGALSVGAGGTTLGTVAAIVLLGGRITVPLQRAVFILVQSRELETAGRDLDTLFERSALPAAAPASRNHHRISGRIELDGVSLDGPTGTPLLDGVSLSIAPGESIAISGPSDAANSALLRVIAGALRPTAGTVLYDGFASDALSMSQLNRIVAYVPADGVLFRGTVRDNITRFGEVTIDEAMEVASLLEVDVAINELPLGLDTELLGGLMENIPPGLRQQLTMVRSLATRPRVILFDNADRGLDRAGYARFSRFIGRIRGQAAMVLVSDDNNLADHTTKAFALTDGHLVPLMTAPTLSIAYRDITP